MEFASLITEFGAHYGMEDLRPDENDAVQFVADGRGISIQKFPEAETIIAAIELCAAAEAGAAMVCRLLMKANQTLFALDGMALVLNDETSRYILMSRFDAVQLDFAGFDGKIARLLDRADQWNEFLERFLPIAAEAETKGAAAVAIPPNLAWPTDMVRV